MNNSELSEFGVISFGETRACTISLFFILLKCPSANQRLKSRNLDQIFISLTTFFFNFTD